MPLVVRQREGAELLAGDLHHRRATVVVETAVRTAGRRLLECRVRFVTWPVHSEERNLLAPNLLALELGPRLSVSSRVRSVFARRLAATAAHHEGAAAHRHVGGLPWLA